MIFWIWGRNQICLNSGVLVTLLACLGVFFGSRFSRLGRVRFRLGWASPLFGRFNNCRRLGRLGVFPVTGWRFQHTRLPAAPFENIQFLEAPMKGSAADAEFLGSLAAVSPAILKRPQDQGGLGVLQIPFAARGRGLKS